MTTRPAALTISTPGFTLRAVDARIGMYAWHRGAFRQITAVDSFNGCVRFGRYSLHAGATGTLEVARIGDVLKSIRIEAA